VSHVHAQHSKLMETQWKPKNTHRAVIICEFRLFDPKKLVIRQTDKRLDSFRYVRVRSYSGFVFSGDSKLVERIFLELLRQRVAGVSNFVLRAAIALPLRRTLDTELDDIVENFCSTVAATTTKTTNKSPRSTVIK